MKLSIFFLSWILFFSSMAIAKEKYGFLSILEAGDPIVRPEAPPLLVDFDQAPLEQEMLAYYSDFASKATVDIYVGYGVEYFARGRLFTLGSEIRALMTHFQRPVSNWVQSLDGSEIDFKDELSGIKYRIDLGHERNAFANAFSHYDVVIYNGHSRYGRGPAFESFENYFRMGSVFSNIEVTSKNSYFLEEPLMRTDRYPAHEIREGSEVYYFQYRGAKIDSSELNKDAYVKLIAGLDRDLQNTEFKMGRQILFIHSCSNDLYFKKPLRRRFPDTGEKMIFGTSRVSTGTTAPDAVMIVSIIRQVPWATQIVAELNATHECDDCFTSY